MSEQGPARGDGYRAFISYSHSDERIAKWLHKRLETYHLPKKLIGASGARGAVPPRLTPIFRDIDELSAANDLSVEIKAALAGSDVLIILCSPAAKASKWVNLEIETFRTLHGGSRPVLAALIDGEPADAFPPALTAYGQEPVAADFRKGRDGKRLALLKLAAGIAGAPLDALVQRDAQRQNRRVMAITGGALAASLVMALLLVVALRSQAEAQRQRAEAEGLVEYMLTDLRDKLKGVGRLDVMTAVNERAMKYYGGQEALEDLQAESLNRRAAILHAMGEDDEKRGNLKQAAEKFAEAHRTTLASLSQKPDDPERIFAHAQSEYWVGYAAWQMQNRSVATKHWSGYLKQAVTLVKIQPQAVRSFMELGYAHANLCDLANTDEHDLDKALYNCSVAIEQMQKALKLEPRNTVIMESIANNFGWLADVFLKLNMNNKALEARSKEFKILNRLINLDSLNISYFLRLQTSKMGSAKIYFKMRNYNKSIDLNMDVRQELKSVLNDGFDDISIKEMYARNLILLYETQKIISVSAAEPTRNEANKMIDNLIIMDQNKKNKYDKYKDRLNK